MSSSCTMFIYKIPITKSYPSWHWRVPLDTSTWVIPTHHWSVWHWHNYKGFGMWHYKVHDDHNNIIIIMTMTLLHCKTVYVSKTSDTSTYVEANLFGDMVPSYKHSIYSNSKDTYTKFKVSFPATKASSN